VLILLLLRGEPMRFNRLRRAIEGLSQKTRSQVLKSLERDALIGRRAMTSVPGQGSRRHEEASQAR
jgi:DNA-binding HxlR family transcriptional regulator